MRRAVRRALPFLLCLPLLLCGCGMSSIPGFGRIKTMPFVGEGGYLPEDDFVPGWKRVGKIRRFSDRTLEEYMGRQAALFYNYGVEVVVVADYAEPGHDDPVLAIESYQMKKPLAASGVFHWHRGRVLRAVGKPADVGAESVVHDRVLYFYKGVHFFKLIYTGKADTPDLVELGQAIAAAVPGAERPPRGFEFVDVPGVDTTTARESDGYCFNYEFLPPGIFAKAPDAGDQAEVFIIGHYGEGDAKNTAKEHRTFLDRYGEDYTLKRTRGGRLVWWGRDPSFGRVIMTQIDSWVVGVWLPQTYERGEIILDRVVARIEGR